MNVFYSIYIVMAKIRTFSFLITLLIAISCDKEIEGPEDITIDVSACTPGLDDNKLDIITWNIQNFPLDANTPEYLDDIIVTLNADVIAIQEVASPFALSAVIGKLQNWEGKIYSQGDHKLGFLYDSTKVHLSEIIVLFEDNTNAFPRPAVQAYATHKKSGEEVTLINVHLKCCNGEGNEQRRESAISALKGYIDGFLPNEKVVLLGDFNDVLDAPEESNIFLPLISEPAKYIFADMEIATGPSTEWSYPSHPSHLDHILVSNELFDNVNNVETINLEDCMPNYAEVISDHRPVLLSLDM